MRKMLQSLRDDYKITPPRFSFSLTSGPRYTTDMQSLSIHRSFYVENNIAMTVTLSIACPFSDLPEVPGLNYI